MRLGRTLECFVLTLDDRASAHLHHLTFVCSGTDKLEVFLEWKLASGKPCAATRIGGAQCVLGSVVTVSVPQSTVRVLSMCVCMCLVKVRRPWPTYIRTMPRCRRQLNPPRLSTKRKRKTRVRSSPLAPSTVRSTTGSAHAAERWCVLKALPQMARTQLSRPDSRHP